MIETILSASLRDYGLELRNLAVYDDPARFTRICVVSVRGYDQISFELDRHDSRVVTDAVTLADYMTNQVLEVVTS